MERFVIIDPMSAGVNSYFCEDGTTTTNIKEAMIVNSMEEGQEKVRFMTLYQPIYKPV